MSAIQQSGSELTDAQRQVLLESSKYLLPRFVRLLAKQPKQGRNDVYYPDGAKLTLEAAAEMNMEIAHRVSKYSVDVVTQYFDKSRRT